MAKQELSDRFCAAAKVPDGKRHLDVFDTVVRGLCLRVSAGGARSFFLIYSKPNGARAWLKLGEYAPPAFTLAMARKRAKDQRVDIGDGADPVAAKKAAAAGQTVNELVESYLTRRVAGKRSVDEIARRLRLNVSAVIGDVKLANLHRRDLTRCIDKVVDRGAGTEANRVFQDMRAMVRWARGRDDLDENLVEGMRAPTETQPRDRVLSDDEIKAFWKALPDADMREGTRRILRLCLITAQRVGEVAGMTRAELDLDAATWTIPPDRVKNKREHVVPLSPMAAQIIREQIADVTALCERKQRKVPAWIFPGPGARSAVTGAAVAKAILRSEWPIEHFTAHDLRRTAATSMERLGVNPFDVGLVLNHVSTTQPSVTRRVYALHGYAQEKRDALSTYAEYLSGIVSV
jgi:integrase